MLSVRQPWAWGLVHGAKREEYRSWRTAYRGIILIHAGRVVDRLDPADLRALGVRGPAPEYARGAVVGAARLADVQNLAGRGYGETGYGWVLADRIALEAFPCRGNLGLGRVPDGFHDSPQFRAVCAHFGL